MTLFRNLLVSILLLFSAAACTTVDIFSETENVEQKHFAMLAVFEEYDVTALTVAKNDKLPREVRSALASTRGVVKNAVVLADEAFNIYAEAKIRAVGDGTAQEVAAALEVYLERFDVADAKVTEFAQSIRLLTGRGS